MFISVDSYIWRLCSLLSHGQVLKKFTLNCIQCLCWAELKRALTFGLSSGVWDCTPAFGHLCISTQFSVHCGGISAGVLVPGAWHLGSKHVQGLEFKGRLGEYGKLKLWCHFSFIQAVG